MATRDDTVKMLHSLRIVALVEKEISNRKVRILIRTKGIIIKGGKFVFLLLTSAHTPPQQSLKYIFSDNIELTTASSLLGHIYSSFIYFYIWKETVMMQNHQTDLPTLSIRWKLMPLKNMTL